MALPQTQPLDYSALNRILGAAPNYKGLLGAANTQARAQVAPTIAALRQQQDQLRQQAALRAQQINAATLAAANFDRSLNLAQRLGASLRLAGQDQAALARGYTGQARDIATQQAAEVNRNLAALGAPGQATDTSAQAGNALYALGGAIPANTLEAYAPYAEAQARAIPAQLLAAGQQQAVAATGLGAQQAAALNPDIAKAAASLPGVAQSIYSDLVSQAQRSHQDAITNMFKALDLQQQGLTAEATRKWRQAQLDQHAADAAAKAARVQGSLSTGLWQVDPKTGKIVQLTQPQPTPRTTVITDASGQWLIDENTGQRIARVGDVPPSQSGSQISGSLTTGIYRENPDGTITVLRKPQPKSAAPKTTIRSGASPIVRVNPDGTVDTIYKPTPGSTGKPYKIPSSVSNKALTLAQRLHGDVGTGAGTLSLGSQTVTLGGSAGAPKPYREALRRVSAYLRAAGVPDKYVRQSAVQTLVAAGYQIPASPQKPGPSIFDLVGGAAAGLTGLAGRTATTVQNNPPALGG